MTKVYAVFGGLVLAGAHVGAPDRLESEQRDGREGHPQIGARQSGSYRSTYGSAALHGSEMMMIPEVRWAPMVAALVYAAIGLVIFGVAFVLVDRLTPYHLWKEIVDEKNTALAIVVGALAIGISIIISAAIR